MDKLFHCEDCKKTFTARSSLNVHIRTFHPDKVNTIKPLKCITCCLKFCSKQELNDHKLQLGHPAVNSEKSTMMNRCPLCEYTLIRSNLINHIQSSHNTTIEKETFNLATMNDFERWKENLEKTTRATFIKCSAPYSGRNFTKTVFQCHRSGSYKSIGKGVKRLKTQGSNKINAHCPAEIKLIQRGEQCEIEFVKTHLGHENTLSHIRLLKADKEEIAAKLAAKIPINTILDEIRDNTDTSNLKRIDIVTRADLHNIQTSYNLKSTDTKSDPTSVDAWVNEVEENNKRLDVAISAITKFSRNKLLEQTTIMNKGKLSSKLKCIRSRHRMSEHLQFDNILIEEAGWKIVSSVSQEIYYIQEENITCECKLICPECDICLHRYSCTCPDFSIKWNMCKHVHLLARYLQTIAQTDKLAENRDLQCNMQEIPESSSSATENFINQSDFPDGSVVLEKQKIERHMQEILQMCTSIAHAHIIQKAIEPIKSTIEAANRQLELSEQIKEIQYNTSEDIYFY